MINKEKKRDLISKFQLGTSDSGSVEVQVAIFSERIKEIAGHLSTNKKDYGALRGLQKLVSKRKRLLSYLKKESLQRYKNLISELGIRG